MNEGTNQKVVVLGASGYVGSRLIPYLINAGYQVRAAARSIKNLEKRPWIKHPSVEPYAVDIFDVPSLRRALEGCSTAFYLVHSMDPSQHNFEDADRKAAQNMVEAAESARVERIIYLGGLGDANDNLSKHLRSRAEVSAILHAGRVPVTTLRAAMIMGTASVSYEILTYLVKRLPILITPRWVHTQSQPISIRNVIGYLMGCLENPATKSQIYDIGGPEVLSYRDLMKIFEEEAGLLRRIVIPVPVLTPRLSSYWINLVTPISASLAHPLAEGLRNRVVCSDRRILTTIPQPLFTARESIQRALGKILLPKIVLKNSSIELPPTEVLYPGDPFWAAGALPKKFTQGEKNVK